MRTTADLAAPSPGKARWCLTESGAIAPTANTKVGVDLAVNPHLFAA